MQLKKQNLQKSVEQIKMKRKPTEWEKNLFQLFTQHINT